MTTAKQRNADEALGRASRALAAKAAEHGLIVKKQCNPTGVWTVSANRVDRTPVWSTGDTELETIDKVLDKLNRLDVAVV